MKTLDPIPDSRVAQGDQDSAENPKANGIVRSREVYVDTNNVADRSSEKDPSKKDNRDILCDHCGLEVPSGLILENESKQFCCHGCRTAYELITSCNLEDFYRLADVQQAVPERQKSDFEEFDTDFFLEKHCKTLGKSGQNGPALKRIVFAIDGLHCSACIWLIEKLPQICPGVVDAFVNWNSQSVTVTFGSGTKLSGVAQTLADLGYFPSIFEQDARTDRSRIENRRSLFDLGLAGAAAGNNMLVALALYLGQYYGMSAAIERLLIFYSGLISLVSVLGPGRKILAKAVWAIRTRTPHMDLPVALGITVGVTAGWINTLMGSSSVFFDSISVLIFVLLLGRYIQQLQQRAAIEKLSLVNRLLPRFCKRQVDGFVEKVAIEQIHEGDQLVIEKGEVIPVDGTIESGISSVDQSILTGESFPIEVAVGDDVFAGTVNLKESLQVQAKETAHASRIATIFQDVEKSVRQKTRIVQFADRIGAWFVVAVLILAATTFLIWLPDLMFAANAAVAVLIVACPCALALATPVAISVALSSALRKKILIKDGDAFERLTKCRTIWFDKTGTLTEGKLQVTEWSGETKYKPSVVAIESSSGHPVAQAIVASLREETSFVEDELGNPEIKNLEHFSNGIEAIVDNETIVVGSRGLVEEKCVTVSEEFQQLENQMLENGWSPVFVAANGQVVAMMSIGDQLRDSAVSVVQKLKQRHRVGILSGDRRQIVERVARKLGIDPENCYSELTPQQKSALVADSENALMIGDGVNDSSALAEANVGIAINDKLDLNSRIAPIVLRSDQLDRVPLLLSASRRVMRLIYRNISISLLYNVIAVSLAIAGYIHPVIAAIFMPISSITILLVSLLFDPLAEKDKS